MKVTNFRRTSPLLVIGTASDAASFNGVSALNSATSNYHFVAVSSNTGQWEPIASASTLSVFDPSTTVPSVTAIDFTSGATVTNLGGGVAGVAVTGGGSLTQAYVGYNTVGSSFESMTQSRIYMKKITLANACLITDIESHIKIDTSDHVSSISCAIFEDSGGSPGMVRAAPTWLTATDLLLEATSATPVARWFGRPLGFWATAGDWWIAAMMSSATLMQIAYDVGTDRYYDSGGVWISDAGFYSVTTSARGYSIRANTVR